MTGFVLLGLMVALFLWALRPMRRPPLRYLVSVEPAQASGWGWGWWALLLVIGLAAVLLVQISQFAP